MNEYWENASIKDWDEFSERVNEICLVNGNAASLLENENTLVLTADEKCGIQALERDAPDLPMSTKHNLKREFNYTRHGTQTLIGAVEVATGLAYAEVSQTRTEVDFCGFIKYVVKSNSQHNIIIVLDQLNTHKSASMVRLVAKINGDTQDLGLKGKSGILKCMSSRMKYLEKKGGRIRFLFTPKHCSWLNLIEVWFSGLSRRVMRCGNFTGLTDLQDKLLAYLKFYNEELAKGFRWNIRDRKAVTEMVEKVKRYVTKL